MNTRLLSRTGVPPYTEHRSQALPGEPEAVTASEQTDLTAGAQRRAADRRNRVWATERERLMREAAWHAAQLRARERQLQRLERQLTT